MMRPLNPARIRRVRAVFDLPAFNNEIAPAANQRHLLLAREQHVARGYQAQLLLCRKVHRAVLRLDLYRACPFLLVQLMIADPVKCWLSPNILPKKLIIAHPSFSELTQLILPSIK